MSHELLPPGTRDGRLCDLSSAAGMSRDHGRSVAVVREGTAPARPGDPDAAGRADSDRRPR